MDIERKKENKIMDESNIETINECLTLADPSESSVRAMLRKIADESPNDDSIERELQLLCWALDGGEWHAVRDYIDEKLEEIIEENSYNDSLSHPLSHREKIWLRNAINSETASAMARCLQTLLDMQAEGKAVA
jgi:hypothetical protein